MILFKFILSYNVEIEKSYKYKSEHSWPQLKVYIITVV